MSYSNYRVLHGKVVVVEYKQGYTTIECNSSSGRTIINNITSDRWIEEQFDRIFDIGEFKKFKKHLVSWSKEKHTSNPHCIHHTLIADYIPKLAKKHMKEILKKEEEKGFPGVKKSDLIGKYFK